MLPQLKEEKEEKNPSLSFNSVIMMCLDVDLFILLGFTEHPGYVDQCYS